MTCAHTSTLGVYLLGALDPEDRSTFESHLSRCDICRSELVRLAPLPGLLNQITPADFEVTGELAVLVVDPPIAPAEPVTEPPGPSGPVVFDLPREPEPAADQPSWWRRYWQVAVAAAAVVVLTVGGIVTYEALRAQPTVQQVDGIIWSATSSVTGVRAEARLIERQWGTEIQVRMDNVPDAKNCRLVVFAKGANGYKETAGWWNTNHEPGVEIPASTSIALAGIYKLEFMDGENLLVDLHRP